MALEDIIAKFNSYLKLIKARLGIILAFALVLGLLLGLYAYTSPTYYKSKASFHPEANAGDGPSLDGLNPFSLLMGGGGLDGSEAVMMEEVLKSRKLREHVVKDSCMFQGQKEQLADLIIEYYPTSNSPIALLRSLFTPKRVYTEETKVIFASIFIEGGLKTEKLESGFLNMEFTFPHDTLTEIISKTYIDKLSQYYTDQKTEKADSNFQFFKRRADSVKNELDIAARALANFEDRNKSLVYARQALSAKEYEIRLEYLKEMYITLVASREQAATQLQRSTPIIQILDEPVPPFEIIRKSALLYSFLGIILGLFLGIFWVSRKLLRKDLWAYLSESMKQSPEEEEE
ncbi:MAG: hypothetical protein AAF696_11805 [Bacteroidota bacterium]